MAKSPSNYALIRDTPAINTETGEEIILPAGILVDVKSGSRCRNYGRLCFYFAFLNDVVQNISEEHTKMFLKNAIDGFSRQGGFITVKFLHEFFKMLYGIESVNFEKLKEKEMSDFVDFVKDKCSILTGGNI